MSIFPAGYLNSHKDDADDSIDTTYEYLKLWLMIIAKKNNFILQL